MKKIIKNVLCAGLVIFIVGLFIPTANASYFESEGSLSTEVVEEIREVALKNKKVLAVETEGIQNLKVKEGYISLEVVRESDIAVLSIPNDELSEKARQEIDSMSEEYKPKTGALENQQGLSNQDWGIIVVSIAIITVSIFMNFNDRLSTSGKMDLLLIMSAVGLISAIFIRDFL